MHRSIAWLAACLMLCPESASAHPGHGVTQPETAAHYVLEPLHALPVLLIALAIGGVLHAARLRRKAAIRREQKSNV